MTPTPDRSRDVAPLAGRLLVARADASPTIGTGHLMRTLALAQAWRDLGGQVRWPLAAAPQSLRALLSDEGIEVEDLAPAAGSTADAQALGARLAADPAACAVVDGPLFEAAFLRAIGGAAGRVLAIDDMALLPAYPVGFVLNQNAHAERAAYPPDAGCRFLLGTRFVLLRREFRSAPPARTAPAVARRILVTFGGADPTGMTARTLAALGRLPAELRAEASVRIVVGASNPRLEEISALAAPAQLGGGITVLHAVADMAAQLAWADLALTSGGSTVWELARVGCPALVVETVPAEVRLVTGLRRVGLFDCLGPEDGLDAGTMATAIATRVADRSWRAAMAARGRELVDGGGARRVALALAGLTTQDEEAM